LGRQADGLLDMDDGLTIQTLGAIHVAQQMVGIVLARIQPDNLEIVRRNSFQIALALGGKALVKQLKYGSHGSV
jgi:hypothetical protein